MEIARRVKKWLSWDEYKKLDKNNRVTPEGELVPVRDDVGELPDPVPLAPPIGFVERPDMFQVMRDMIRGEHLRAYAEAQGAETFEEASDFNVEDDPFPASEFEGEFEPFEDLQAARQSRFRRRFIEEEENASYKEWREKVLEERQRQIGALRTGRDSDTEVESQARPEGSRAAKRAKRTLDAEDAAGTQD